MLGQIIRMGQNKLVASGTIAAGDNKLDYTSDNAFIEFGVDISAYHGNHKIVVTDSAGKSASGYLHSVAPGGETLGENYVTNGDFSSETGWVFGTGCSIIGGACVSDGSIARYQSMASRDVGNHLGQVIKGSIDISSCTAGNLTVRAHTAYFAANVSSVDTHSVYAIISSTDPYLYVFTNSATSFTGTFDNVFLQRVTDCAATGALIVSALGGSTRSWTSVDAGFNPNLACTYKIYRLR